MQERRTQTCWLKFKQHLFRVFIVVNFLQLCGVGRFGCLIASIRLVRRIMLCFSHAPGYPMASRFTICGVRWFVLPEKQTKLT